MHLNSQLLFERFATPYFQANQRVLEIGADGDPSTYRRLLEPLPLRWETADLADDVMDALAPGGAFRQAVRSRHVRPTEYEIPVPDGTFDVVVAGNVAEHVRRVWVWVAELARVTRPGGMIVIVSPISWPYHAAPVDCWRIHPEGMRALCDEAGLTVLVCQSAALEPPVSRRRYLAQTSFGDGGRAANRRLGMVVKQIVGWPSPTALDVVAVAQ
jgi:SAM-dependent methyltransferase